MWTAQVAMAIEAWRAENGGARLPAGWMPSARSKRSPRSPTTPGSVPAIHCRSSPQGAVFDAEDLGHPLLPEDRCVRNSVALVAPRQLLVVSGSNMSGKSTLLRAAGINAVLALAGAPVRAKRLTISQLSLGASIRTMDSLEEGHSRFMAEILRLKQILELPPPAFFLLDELLHGTNSHDRAIGAEGLIRALLEAGRYRAGHCARPLAGRAWPTNWRRRAENVHFEDRLENGGLVFDYRMRPGVVCAQQRARSDAGRWGCDV